jgi:ABC-type nitrate/sulfonate/bicarbonate transport system substrate-binding protein
MRTLALAVAPLLAALAIACGDDDGGGAQKGDGGPARVVVGVIPIADVAPAWLGAEKGFFRDEDIDVSFRLIAGGAEVIPQVLRGDVQFAFGNPVSLAFAQQRGLELRYATEGVQGGSSEKDATNGLVVHKESDIRSVGDLAGKTFAVNVLNSLGEVTIRTALEKEGVDVSGLEFVEVPFPDMLPALERRQFDVAWLPEPFVSQALAAGHRNLLDPMVATHPRLTLSGYFGSSQFFEENADLVERFQRAMNRSLDYAAAHEDEARQAIAENTEIPPPVVEKMPLPHWTSDLNEESIRFLIGQAEKYDYFDEDIDVEALLPPESTD